MTINKPSGIICAIRLFLICIGVLFIFQAFADDADPDSKAPKTSKPGNVTIKWDPDNKEVSEFIPLKGVDYEMVDEMCRPWLSETGTMGHMPERQQIVVHELKKNVDKIRKFVEAAAENALPEVNIRVDIEFIGNSANRKRGIKADFGKKPGEFPSGTVIMKNGKVTMPNNISISANDQSTRNTSFTSQFIVTMSGSPARLWVGKTIVDPSWLNNYKFQPIYIIHGMGGGTVIIPSQNPDLVWANVGTYLYVLPTYLGDGLIDVEVFPAVSYLDGKGKRQTVKVESISTRVTVRSGQKIPIGGIVNKNRDFYSSFFGTNCLSMDDSTSVLDMNLTATVMQDKRQDR